MMTKRDYQMIAETLREHRQSGGPEDAARVDDLAHVFADKLERENPRFDRAEFLAVAKGDELAARIAAADRRKRAKAERER